MTFFDFADKHWFIAIFLAMMMFWLILAAMNTTMLLWKRWLRHRNIVAQGWPPSPLDADGDVIWPKEGEEGDDD